MAFVSANPRDDVAESRVSGKICFRYCVAKRSGKSIAQPRRFCTLRDFVGGPGATAAENSALLVTNDCYGGTLSAVDAGEVRHYASSFLAYAFAAASRDARSGNR